MFRGGDCQAAQVYRLPAETLRFKILKDTSDDYEAHLLAVPVVSPAYIGFQELIYSGSA